MDQANFVLVAYFPTIIPNDKVGVLLPKGVEDTSKVGKASKKPKKVEQPNFVLVPIKMEVIKPVQEPGLTDVPKVVVRSKTGVLK